MAMNTWVTNFGKSVKFGAIDVARDQNPAITKLYDDNKEFMSSIASTLADIYSGQTKITKALEGAAPDLSKSMSAVQGGWDVAKKDAKTFFKTGKVAGYGFEGAGASDESFKEAGMEMDDGFNFSGDEFNFDDLPDPESLMKGIDAEASPSTEAVATAGAAEVAAINEGIKADVKIGAANVAAINKATGAVGAQTKVVAEGFKSVANVNYQLSASMILAQQSIAEKTKQQLTMINDNIANLISFNQDTNLKYTMAAMKYFDDSLEELRKISAGMERMAPAPKEKSNTETDYDKVFGGGFNLQSYWEVIKTNAQNTELGPLLGFLEQPEMIVEAFREPMKLVLNWGMTSLIPSVVKKATKELNRTIEEFIPALFAKLSTMGEDYSTNPIFQFIGKLFGVNIGSSALDLSNYEKGAVPFDGITHKSINQVIPTYLSQIVSLLSGGEMRMFDHERGRFYTMSQLRREENLKDEQDRDYALGEGGRILDKMKDDFAFETQEQEKAFAKYIEDFKNAVVKSRKFIDWNKQADLDDLFSQIYLEGVDPQTAAMMQQVLPDYFANYIRKNLSHSQQIRMANASNIAAMEKRRRLKNEDARGMAMSRYILSGNSDIELANDVDAFNRRTAEDIVRTTGNISSVINLNGTGTGNPPPPPGGPSPGITGTSEGKATFNSTGMNRRYGPDVRDYREQQEAKDKAAIGEVTYNKDYSKLIDQGMANLDDLIGGVEYATEKIAEFRRKQTAGSTAELDDQGLPITDDDDYEYEGEAEERERRKREEESFMDKVGRWMNRPTKLLTEAIETIDSTLYRVLFGASPDEESLLHVLVENVKSVFGRLKTFLRDEFYSPIKKFLFGDDFKKSNFYRFFSGAFEKGKSVFNGDFFTEVREQIKEDATDWKDDVTDYIAGSKFKGGRINEAGSYILSAGERVEHSGIKDHLAAGTDVIGSTGVYDLKAGDKVTPTEDMKKAAESEATFSFKMFEKMHGGLSSKLDQVISAINNNTSVMSTDINAVQSAVEEGTVATKDVGTKVVATSAGEGKQLPVDTEPVGKAKTPKEILDRLESIKKLTGRQKKPFVDVILDKILNATGTFAAMFGGSKNLDNQHIQKEYMKDIRQKAPKVISRGLLGGGFLAAANLSGALTGAHGFGLLGSFFLPGGLFPALMLGMGVSMLHQSDRFTNMMYGRKIDGERQGGIIPKKVIDFFSKHKKHILAGGTIGLLSNLTGLPLTIPKLVLGAVIPGGGMLGGIALSTIGPVLIGSAAAVALHSDKFKRVLFGTGNPEDGKKQFGALNGQFMQRVKKALPNAVVGAGMGYLGMSTLGSIGLLGTFALPAWGGALLGGAIGIGMASDKFKEQMFGKMVNGKFVSGGLVDVMQNAVKAEILKPLSVFAQQSLVKTERFMALEILMPIRKAMLPYKMLLEATFKKITTGLENFFKGVGNSVNRTFSPILSFLSKVIKTAWDWTWGASKKIINTVFSVAGTAISMPFKALGMSGSMIGWFQNDENKAILREAKERNKAIEAELKAKYNAKLAELDAAEKEYKAERRVGRASGYEATEAQLAAKTEQYQQEQEFIKQAQLQADKEAAIRREKAEVQREELKDLVKTTNFKLEELSRENKRLLIELTGISEEELSAEERIAELKVEEKLKAKPKPQASTITTLAATNVTPASGITSATAPKPLQSSQDKSSTQSTTTHSTSKSSDTLITSATSSIKATEPPSVSSASSTPKPATTSIKPTPITTTRAAAVATDVKSDKILTASLETVEELRSVDRNVSNIVEVLKPISDTILKQQTEEVAVKRTVKNTKPVAKSKPYIPKQGANATANAIKAADKAASSSSSSTSTTIKHAPSQQASITATQASSIDSSLSESAQYEAQALIKQDLMIQSLERLYSMLEFKFDDLLATNVEEVKETKKSNKSQLVKEVMSGAARQAGSKALDSIASSLGSKAKEYAKEKFEEHAKGFLTKVGTDVGKAIEDKLTALSTTSAGIITSQVNAGLSYLQGQMKTGFEAIYKKITGQDFDWSAINAGGGPPSGDEDHTSENISELTTLVKTNFPIIIGKSTLIADYYMPQQLTKLDKLILATNDVVQAIKDIDFSGPTPPTSTGSPSGHHATGGIIKKTGTYLLSAGERVLRAGKGTDKDVAKSQESEANFALKMFEKIYGNISTGLDKFTDSMDRAVAGIDAIEEVAKDEIVETIGDLIDSERQFEKDLAQYGTGIESMDSTIKELFTEIQKYNEDDRKGRESIEDSLKELDKLTESLLETTAVDLVNATKEVGEKVSDSVEELSELKGSLKDTGESIANAVSKPIKTTERFVDESQVPVWAKEAFKTSQQSIAKLESDAKETSLLRDSSGSIFDGLFGLKKEEPVKPEGLLRDSDKNIGQIFGGKTADKIIAERKDDKFRDDLLSSIRGLKVGQIKAEEKKESWFDKLKGLLGGLFGMLPDILKIGAILAALGAIKLSFSQSTHTDPNATDPYAENVANKERRIIARTVQRGARWAGRQIVQRTGRTFTNWAHHALDTVSGANARRGLGGPGTERFARGAEAGVIKEEYLNKAIAHEERYTQIQKEIEQLKLTSTGKIDEVERLKQLEKEAEEAKKFSDQMLKMAGQMEARELGTGANSSIMDTIRGRNPEAQDAFTKIHDIGNKAINAVKNSTTLAKIFGPVGHRNFVGKLVEMLGKITIDFVTKHIGPITVRLAKAGIRIGGLLTGGIATAIFAGIDAFHGASNASTFFHVDPDKVDAAMIAISSAYSVLAGLPVIPGPIPINPLFVFDLIIDIVYGITGGSVDTKKHLFAMMYEAIPFEGKQNIEQLQADSDAHFEDYKKQAGNSKKTYLDYQHDMNRQNTYIANAIRENIPGGSLLVGDNDEDGVFRHGLMSGIGEEWEQTKGLQVLNPMWINRGMRHALFGGKNERGEERRGLLSGTFIDRGIESAKSALGIEDEPEIPELVMPTFNTDDTLNTFNGKVFMLRKMGLNAKDFTKEEIAKWDPRSGKLPNLEDMDAFQQSTMEKIDAFRLSAENIIKNFSTGDFLDTFEGKTLLLQKMGIGVKDYTKEMIEKWDPRSGTLPDMKTALTETQAQARDALTEVQEKVKNAKEAFAKFDPFDTLEGKKALIKQIGIDVSTYTDEQIKNWDPLSGYLPDMSGFDDAQFNVMNKIFDLRQKASDLIDRISEADPLSTIEGKAVMLYQMGIDAESYTEEQLENWDPLSGKLPDMKTALTDSQAKVANRLTEYKQKAQEIVDDLSNSDPIKSVEGKMSILAQLGFDPSSYSRELLEKWDPTSGMLPDATQLNADKMDFINRLTHMTDNVNEMMSNLKADEIFTTVNGKRNLLYSIGVDSSIYSDEDIEAWDPKSGKLPDSKELDRLQEMGLLHIQNLVEQQTQFDAYLENEDKRDKQKSPLRTLQRMGQKINESLTGISRYLFGVSENEELPEGDEMAKDRRGVVGKFVGSVTSFFFGEKDVGDYKGQDGILNRIVQGLNDWYDNNFKWFFGDDESDSDYKKASVIRRALHDAIFFLVGGTHGLTGEHKPFTESYLFEPMVKIRKGFNAVSDWIIGGDENSQYGGKNVLKRALETGIEAISSGFNSLAESVSSTLGSAVEWITGGEKDGPYGGKFFLRRGLEAGLKKVNEGFKVVADTVSKPLKNIGTKANEAFQYIFGGQLKEDLRSAFSSAVEWITGGAMDSIYKGKNFLKRGFEKVEVKATEIATDVTKTVTDFKDYVAEGFTGIVNWITGGKGGKNFLQRGLEAVETKASEIAKNVSDKFEEFSNSVTSVLSGLIENITGFYNRSKDLINQQGLLKGGFNILANMLRGMLGLEWDLDPLQKAIDAGSKAFRDAFGELGTVGNGILKFFKGIVTFIDKAIGLGPVKIVKMLAEWAFKGGAKADVTSAQKNLGGFWDEVNKAVGGGGKEEINTNPPPEYNAYSYVNSLIGGGAEVPSYNQDSPDDTIAVRRAKQQARARQAWREAQEKHEKEMYFSQKDPNWSSKSLVRGMDNYGNMSKLGCFPTVIAGATNAAYGRPVVKPDTVAGMISKNDVAQNGSGTLPSFGPKAASAMGGTFNALDPNDTQSIDNALKKGYKVIGSKPGHYTLYDSHGTHDPLGDSYNESVSAEKISKNAKAPGSPTTVGIITPRGIGLPRDVKSIPLTPSGVQQGSDLQKTLLQRRAEQVLAMRSRLFGGSGNVMHVDQQEGPTCTLHATKVMYKAYRNEDVDPSFGTWAGMMDSLPSQEKQFGDRDSFENAVRSHFESKPTNPVFLYQTGGDGRFGNPINAINRWSGNHATVIGRKTSDGKYDVYDSNGGKVHHLELSQIYDQSARGGSNGMPEGAGNALWVPTIDPSSPIDQWQDSTGDSAAPGANNEGGPSNPSTQTSSTSGSPASQQTSSGNFLSDLVSGFASGLSGGNSIISAATNALTSGDTNNTPAPAPSGDSSGKDQMSEQEIWNWFRGKGYTPEVTAGIMGRLKQENNFKPTYAKFQYVPGVGECGGFGMFQWTYDNGSGYEYPDPLGADKATVYQNFPDSRLVKYMKWVDANKGGNYESAGNELEYMYDTDMKEKQYFATLSRYVGNSEKSVSMDSWYPNDFNKLNMHQAAVKWTNDYEVGQEGNELTYAQEFYDKFKNGGGGFGGLANYMSSGIYGGGGKGINDAIETNLQWASPLETRPSSELIIVHNSGAGAGKDEDHDAQWLHEIGLSKDDMKGAAYHFNIRKNGDVEKLRPLDALGSHAGGTNSNSIGIHVAGDFYKDSDHTGPHHVPQESITNADMTLEQQDSLSQVVADIAKTYNIPIDRKHVVGHWEPYEIEGISDIPGAYNPKDTTACPGAGIMDHLDDVVNKARELQGLPPAQGTNPQPQGNVSPAPGGSSSGTGSKFSIIGQALGAIIRGRMNTFMSGEDEIGKMLARGEFNFSGSSAPSSSGTPTPSGDGTTQPTDTNTPAGIQTGSPSGDVNFNESWTGLGQWDKLDAYATFMSDYAKSKFGVDVPTWWWRSILRAESGPFTSWQAKNYHNFGGMNYDPYMQEYGGTKATETSAHGNYKGIFPDDKSGLMAEVAWFCRPGADSWWTSEIAAAQSGDWQKAMGLHVNHYVVGQESGDSLDDHTDYRDVTKEEFERGDVRYGGGGGLNYLLNSTPFDIGGGGSLVYDNISEYQGIPDNIITENDTISVQRAKYEAQLQHMRGIRPTEVTGSGNIRYDELGNILGLNIPEYNIITVNDSKSVSEAKKKAQIQQYLKQGPWGGGGTTRSSLVKAGQNILKSKKGGGAVFLAPIAFQILRTGLMWLIRRRIGSTALQAAERKLVIWMTRYETQILAKLRKYERISDIIDDIQNGIDVVQQAMDIAEDFWNDFMSFFNSDSDGGGGVRIYDNLSSYTGIRDNIIYGTETIPVQRAKYEAQLRSMQNILPESYNEDGIQYDELGNILGLVIPEYNLITPDDSIAVKRAKHEAQLAQLNGGGGKINYLAALFGDKEAQRAIGEAWSDKLHPRKAKAKREAAKAKEEESKPKPSENPKRDFSKWTGGEYFNDVNAVHPMVHDYLKGNATEADLKKVIGVPDNETYLTAEQQQMLGFREYAKDVRTWNHFTTSSKLWTDGITPVEVWIQSHPEAQWKSEKQDEKKPDTAVDIAKIEGETFVDEKDDSPTAKLARELKVRFDRLGNAIHPTEKYPDELKITEKDDNATKYSKQAKQLAYLKELQNAAKVDAGDKPEETDKTKHKKKTKTSISVEKPKADTVTENPEPNKEPIQDKPKEEKRHKFDFYKTNLGKLLQGFGIGPKRKKEPEEETAEDIADETNKSKRKKKGKGEELLSGKPVATESAPKLDEINSDLIVKREGKPEDFGLDKLKADPTNPDLLKEVASKLHLEFDALGNVKGLTKVPEYNIITANDDLSVRYAKQRTQIVDFIEYGGKLPDVVDEKATRKAIKEQAKKEKGESSKETPEEKTEEKKPKLDPNFGLGESLIDEKDESPVAKMARELGLKFDGLGNIKDDSINIPKELVITATDDESTKYTKQAKQIANYKKWKKQAKQKKNPAVPENLAPKPTDSPDAESSADEPELQPKTNPIGSTASSSDVEYQSSLISAIKSIDIRRQADMMVKYLEIIANGQSELAKAFSGKTPSGPSNNNPGQGMLDLSAGQGSQRGRFPTFSPNTGAQRKTDSAGKLDYSAIHSKNMQIAMGGEFANA